MNSIKYSLNKTGEYYLIIHEEFNYDDALFLDIEEENCETCNSSLNKTERNNSMNSANKFISQNVSLIFKYFSTHDDKLLKSLKKEGSLGIGTYFNTKSIRASTSPGTFGTTPVERTMAFLGWINATNYITNDDVEINAILIPSKTNRILKPYEYVFQDKEENKLKSIHYFGKRSKKSDIILQAEIYVNTIAEYLAYKETNSKDVELESVLFMVLTKAGQKPIPNKFFEMPVYEWTKELYVKLGQMISYSSSDLDIKDMTARFIVKPSLANFHKLIQIYSKKNCKIDSIYREEILRMYENKVQEIHNNEAIKKLGRGLNRLLYSKKGFEILTKLYTVRTVESLSYRIRELEDSYLRYGKHSILSDKEHIEVINLINTKKDAVICANAIISFGRVFHESSKKGSNNSDGMVSNTKEIDEFEIDINTEDAVEKIVLESSVSLNNEEEI
ncbi:hypothetical protein [Clostridium cellulovorans]|uniref:Uncharacterized protein n=1 Tax=Clostridium cellulovorans (strain ATCC 35296 / DSM 3052 / OCM 3 / 743B) TaxID=573061 RepID=D9SP82_CLOC7|nr:hypothetical protein [Clostridium cellulovorans]ADL52047.1 hypothetical protein Clocel_2328 [Clostridium cellulovorans 743B]